MQSIGDIPRETFTLPSAEEIANATAKLTQAPVAQHDKMVDREAMLDG